jgi:hypothetical protein
MTPWRACRNRPALPCVTVSRLSPQETHVERKKFVSRVAVATLPMRHGAFEAILYHSEADNIH